MMPCAELTHAHRNREAVLYHDWLGPSLLCTVLLVSVIVNFTLRFREATA